MKKRESGVPLDREIESSREEVRFLLLQLYICMVEKRKFTGAGVAGGEFLASFCKERVWGVFFSSLCGKLTLWATVCADVFSFQRCQ